MKVDPVPVLKDLDGEHPVPTIWRSTFRELADAIAGIGNVDGLIAADELDRFRKNIAAYPAALGPLPDETWKTSVVQWTGGYWDVLIDLFDEAAHRTDLVMQVEVTEAFDDYKFKIHAVYVP